MIAAQALIGDQVKLHSDSKLTLQVVLGTRSMRATSKRNGRRMKGLLRGAGLRMIALEGRLRAERRG